MYKCMYLVMSATLQRLSQQLRRLERGKRLTGCQSTGIPALDRLLPDGGLRRGTLVEWLADGAAGAGTLAFQIAAHVCGESGVRVVIDSQGALYPPATRWLGGAPDATIVVRPLRVREALWAWEQALRCPAVAVVIGSLKRLQPLECRRLQLAAEAGGGIGMLLRSARDQQSTSWADLRFRVTPQAAPLSRAHHQRPPPPRSRRLQVELLHGRGHFGTGIVLLDIDDETGAVRQVPRLVTAARARRASGA